MTPVPSKVMSLDDATRRFVEPAMHLHFAATPARSNAGVRAVCRLFRGTSPSFCLSTTGFHSTAHLLARLRLGRRYISCFFGDNYPSPRPNPLYQRLGAEGAAFEHWSLLSYVTALRAGALGHPFAVTTSLVGSSLGDDLAAQGRLHTVSDPDQPGVELGLVRALRPDVAFVHAAAADASGRVLASAPFGEGAWGALAAKRGVIVTVERVVDGAFTARFPESVLLPPHRVLAVCPSPFGAHPQPLLSRPHLGLPSYADDFEAYELLRAVAADDDAHAGLVDDVLLSPHEAAYAAHFELDRRAPEMRARRAEQSGTRRKAPTAMDALVLLAAQRIADRVERRGHRVILAGIGHAFAAARLAKLLLDATRYPVDVVVETGMLDIDCARASGGFLLSHAVMEGARRLSSVEDALGAIVCGADNRCLGVIGAAEVDAVGNVNSTRLADGRMLVGSGGANDIASSAAEVMVLCQAGPERLVERAFHVTSPGRRVREIVTDLGVLCREADGPWRIEDARDPPGGEAGSALREACPFPIDRLPARPHRPFDARELALHASLEVSARPAARRTG
jgi:acyl CoA:acetate/3-ketoacid CoA transferase alpha subunit/acyl CoA:acetate/3-ketoacid CoA transferase beta subunit